MNAKSHSQSGEPDSREDAMHESNKARERTWLSVMSRENRVRRSWREKLGG